MEYLKGIWSDVSDAVWFYREFRGMRLSSRENKPVVYKRDSSGDISLDDGEVMRCWKAEEVGTIE